jgi:hypothetical protein
MRIGPLFWGLCEFGLQITICSIPALLKGVPGPVVPDAILNVHLAVILNDQVHPVSTRRTPRFWVWPTAARWRAHQVDDSLRGPKTAYAPGDATPLARPITDRSGYRWYRKPSEVWP